MNCIIKSKDFEGYYLSEYKSFKQIWSKNKNKALVLYIDEATKIQLRLNQKTELQTI